MMHLNRQAGPERCADSSVNLSPGEVLTRAFSGRIGRAIETDYTRAISSPEAPRPCSLSGSGRIDPPPMRQAAAAENDVQRMSAWTGQSAALARAEPVADFVRRIWEEAKALLP
jgi:nitronate monooxygenase